MSRCTAVTVKGEPCRSSAMPGVDTCSSHMGVRRQATLTVEVADRIVALLRAGNYAEVAAAAAGVSRARLSGWLTRGRAADAPAEFREFAERVDEARAQAEARNVAVVMRAAQEDWRASVWLLERTNPDRWARPAVQRDVVAPAKPAAEAEAKPTGVLDELQALRNRRGRQS